MPEVTIVDACLRQGRGGSPTAVLDDASYTDAERRRVPVAAGTSHAVFIAALDDADRGRQSYRLRYFTSEGELPACGHGTVAALAVLAVRSGGARYRLHTTSRVVEGWVRHGHDALEATFDPGPIELREIGRSERAAIATSLGPAGHFLAERACVASNGRPRLLLPVRSRTALAGLRPDFAALRRACDRYGLLGCYVYTSPDAEGRAAARMFAPSIGVPEDVANANSTACLAAYLADQGVTGIAVDMGDQLGNPSTITANARRRASGVLVRAGGTAKVAHVVRLSLPKTQLGETVPRMFEAPGGTQADRPPRQNASMGTSPPRPDRPVRGSATGSPVMAALDLFGRRWPLRVLCELRDGALGFRSLQQHCDGMPSSVLQARLVELQKALLVLLRPDGSYQLTELGAGAYEALLPLHRWSDHWAVALGTVPPLVPEDHECASCGLNYPATSASEAAILLGSLPARYRDAVGGLTDAALRHRAGPGTWSSIEYLCHVRDVFDVYTDRINQTLAQERPVLEPMRNDRRAVEGRYNHQNAHEVLDALAHAAAELKALITTITPEQWSRTATRLPDERRTLLWMIRQAAHEGVHHLRDIESLNPPRR